MMGIWLLRERRRVESMAAEATVDRRKIDQGPAQLSAALICCTVLPIRPVTVAMDSASTRADGRLLTRIWNATVTTQLGEIAASAPPLLELDPPAAPDPGRASGRMAKPDGSIGMADASSPLITMFAVRRSIGEYTTSDDPDASVLLS